MYRLKQATANIIVAIILTQILTYFYIPVSVRGVSMFPTHVPGDILIVSRLTYMFREPRVGDRVTIDDPTSGLLILKRIVAEPHDDIKITIIGQFYRNGELQEEPYLNEEQWYSPYINTPIPEGAYFVMGDNRNTSYDSRHLLSFVGRHQIEGRVVFNLTKFITRR